MKPLTIAEIPCSIWNIKHTLDYRIDRSGISAHDYFYEKNIVWELEDFPADIRIYKENVSKLKPRQFIKYIPEKLSRMKTPHILLIGEPREFAPLGYMFADPNNTLAVAPGNNLKRLYFCGEWADPQLDDWHKRQDKFLWIGRPTPERIEIARKIIDLGIDLDIYSKDPWPFPNWKGYAEIADDIDKKYKYRIVSENSKRYKYHSEKLFCAIRSGNVTFYESDNTLDLSHLGNAFLPLDFDLLLHHKDLSSSVLKGMENFMFTDACEVYSLKEFCNKIINLVENIIS